MEEKKKESSLFVKIIQKLVWIYNNIERFYMIIFTSGIAIFILYDIIARNLGGQGLKWIEEMGRMMLVTTTILGCSMAVKDNGHAVMDTLYNFLPGKVCYVMKIIVNIICGAGFIYLGYYAVQWTTTLYKMKKTLEAFAAIQQWIFWVVISIGFITMGFRYLIQIVSLVKKMSRGVPFGEIELKEM